MVAGNALPDGGTLQATEVAGGVVELLDCKPDRWWWVVVGGARVDGLPACYRQAGYLQAFCAAGCALPVHVGTGLNPVVGGSSPC
jgi:hypothetical protein